MRTRHKTKYPGISFRLVDESRPDGPRRYIVWYSDTEGNGHTKTLPLGATLEDARLLQGSLQQRKKNGESLVASRMTVSELLDQWLETRRPSLSPKSVETYEWAIESHLKKEFGRKRVGELSPSDVARMIAKLKREGKKTWTVRKILTTLGGAYRVAVRDNIVASSPVTKLLPHERPKGDQREMRCLSREGIDALLRSTGSRRWKSLFALLAFSGLRISEALSLTWKDVGEDKIVIRKSKTKAGEREVMLIPSVRRLLTALRLEQSPGTEHVFANPKTGRPFDRKSALMALHEAERKAGIPNYTLHELRHTFASILIAQGELPTFVAKQMGHSDPSITMKVYAHLWEAQESTDKARERLQASMGGLV